MKPERRNQEVLIQIFQKINAEHFDAFLDPPVLEWNPRLRTSAGRFFAAFKGSGTFEKRSAKIEIASYLLEEENSLDLIAQAMAHEMIHYWLWLRGQDFGHNEEFLEKMKSMGAKRYNPVPKKRAGQRTLQGTFDYRCRMCKKTFVGSRTLSNRACANCCNEHAGGKYDARFKLERLQNRRAD